VNRFDHYAAEYSAIMNKSVGWISQDHDAFVAVKARLILRLLRQYIGDPKQTRVLDVGCGIGLIDHLLVDQVGVLHGLDVSEESIRLAAKGSPDANFRQYDGKRMPYSDGAFDLTFAVCVVHHVPRPDWSVFVAEMARVLRPGGLALIIEHNPFNPVTRHVVNRCEFDRDAVLLTARTCRHLMHGVGLKLVEKNYITFIPFQMRWVEQIEQRLGWLPLGAQYIVAATKV
jgi:ubiquinone/menaquinone biosynthesis C-methylase UbiE